MDNITIDDLLEKYKPKKIDDILMQNNNHRFNQLNIEIIGEWLDLYEQRKIEFLKKQEEDKDKPKKPKPKKDKKKEEKNDDDLSENDENFEENEEITKYVTINNTPKKLINNFSCLTVFGGHGSGKSSIVKALLNDKKYNISQLNINDLINEKYSKDTLLIILKNSSVVKKDNKHDNKLRVLLIDDIDSLTTTHEQHFIEELFNVNSKIMEVPIIFISHLKHTKMTKFLKKNTFTLQLNNPSNDDIMSMLNKIMATEKIGFRKDDYVESAKLIIKYAQNDFSRLIYIFYNIVKNYGKKIIYENVKTCCDNFGEKYEDVEIYDCTYNLLMNSVNNKKSIRIYNSEKTTLPLMIHQNYYLVTNNLLHDSELSTDVAEMMSFSDIIENHMYSERSWNMHSIHCYCSCIYPSYNISKEVKKKKLTGKQLQLEFAADYNRTTIKQINKKNITKVLFDIPKLNIFDIMNMIAIIKQLILNQKYEECCELLKSYNVGIEVLTPLIKINKININNNKHNELILKLIGSNKIKKKLSALL